MNIYEATKKSLKDDLFIRKRDRTEEWCLYVSAGGVYNNQDGDIINLDARDCLGNDWYLIDYDGNEVKD